MRDDRADGGLPRLGAWAIVAGASEGLGAAFAWALARRGYHLILLARRGAVLRTLADAIRSEHDVEVHPVVLDLGDAELDAALARATEGLEIGVGVYNAAYSPVGALVERPLAELLQVVDVNVRGPLIFARRLAPAMAARRRGALVLMSSLAGHQGTPRLAAYAASKAFNTVLAEGLWEELRGSGVRVIASCAGAIRTPGHQRAGAPDAPGSLEPEEVAARTLASLDRRRGPTVVPGLVNKLASAVMRRVLPRRAAIAIMRASTRELS